MNKIDLQEARLGYLYVSLAAVFLGEVMATFQIMGGLIVIVSIIMLQLNTADN